MAVVKEFANLTVVVDSKQVDDANRKLAGLVKQASLTASALSAISANVSVKYTADVSGLKDALKGVEPVLKAKVEVDKASLAGTSQAVQRVGDTFSRTGQSTKSLKTDIDSLVSSSKVLNGTFKEAESGSGSLLNSINRVTAPLRELSFTLWALSTIPGVGQIARILNPTELAKTSDEWTNFNNRLKLVTDTQKELVTASNDVVNTALKTGQSLESVSVIYNRFAQNADQLGVSQERVARITETVAKAVAISGTTAQSAKSAIIQFGQGLAAGQFR